MDPAHKAALDHVQACADDLLDARADDDDAGLLEDSDKSDGLLQVLKEAQMTLTLLTHPKKPKKARTSKGKERADDPTRNGLVDGNLAPEDIPLSSIEPAFGVPASIGAGPVVVDIADRDLSDPLVLAIYQAEVLVKLGKVKTSGLKAAVASFQAAVNNVLDTHQQGLDASLAELEVLVGWWSPVPSGYPANLSP